MKKLRAIETTYSGVTFRSRLEARWARFFDVLGLRWEYEPEGYELADGSRYLPDFWLPGFHDRERGVYVEVKPDQGSSASDMRLPDTQFAKAYYFAKEHRAIVWLAEGPPAQDFYVVIFPVDPGRLERETCRPLVGVVDGDDGHYCFCRSYEFFGEAGRQTCDGFDAAIAASRAHRFWDPRGPRS